MKRRKLPLIIFVVFVVIMIAGLSLGEYAYVLEKAVTICLSCIGIG
ncbi:MAG: hypothetical protein JSV17_13930 [Candidatus Aminicenantes bacterium]|nr:MAG: hypothetical protein JSV17_13930 [Candidatus Aminicenantes bacterium]